MPSSLTLRAEIHPSRSVSNTAVPLAAVTLAVTSADVQPWFLEFSSQQTNLDLLGKDRRDFVLTLTGIESSTRLYTLADADLTILRHPCSQLVPVAVSPLLYATTEDLDDIDARLTVVEENGGGGGGGGGATNLTTTVSPTQVVIVSDTGTAATIPAADVTNAGVMLPAQVTKLAGVASGATANSSDATLLARGNHTGTQAISTIVNLQTSLDNKAPTSHTHSIADVTGLQTALDGKAASSHAHSASAISDSTTLGQALMVAANPGAITFLRVNADNSVTLLDAASFRTAIGAGAGTPAGSGTELQFRNGSTFGALAGSSVSGNNLTLVTISGTSSSWSSFMNATEVIAFSVLNIGNKGTSNFASLRPNTSAPNHLIFGAADAAAPSPQTISVQSATAGVSRAGALWTFDGSQGAGTGASGPIRFRVGHPAISDAASTFVHPLRESFRLRPTNGVSFSNGNFAAEQDSIGELTTLRGYTTDSTNPVVLSEIWGPSWVNGTIYAAGQHVSIGRENWRCTVAHTAVAANNRPSSGSNWTTVWTSVAIVPRGIPIPANTVIHALVIVTGVQQATGTVFRYMRQVTARNVSGLVTVQGTVEPVGVDTGGTTAISIVANDTDDTLEIRMTGISSTNIRWTAAALATETTIEA
jgi:hypothetical protein